MAMHLLNMIFSFFILSQFYYILKLNLFVILKAIKVKGHEKMKFKIYGIEI